MYCNPNTDRTAGMPTKGDKSTDSEGSSLAGVLEMLQAQNRAMQEQHKAQQKMLLDLTRRAAASGPLARDEGLEGWEEGRDGRFV